MLKSFCSTVLALFSCTMLLSGCGGGKVSVPAETKQVQLAHVSCIGVLPATSMTEGEVVPVFVPKEKNLRRGIQIMNKTLSQELGGKNNTRFIGIDQISALEFSGGESSLELARMIGRKTNCNAVLESMVKRFTERVGSRYSVESPASVAFEMRLISIDNDSVLWSAKFDEAQKSVMENIYEWKKANTRGFVWITAEELMREGIKGKLSGSPYFNTAGGEEQNGASAGAAK